jgi:hypothetical protein
MNTGAHRVTQPIHSGALVIASAVAAAAFFVLGLIAFVHPADRPSKVGTPYTQRVSFGYGARVPAGLIYPNGVLTTGDPIFLSLVHQLAVGIDYRLATAAPHNVSGTEQILLRISGPGGWSRSIPMAALRHFSGDHVSAQVTLDVPRLQSLLARVGALMGVPGDAGYTLAVVPQVSISGTVAGRPVKTTYKPSLAFELGPTQLDVGGGSATSGTPAAAGSTSSSASSANFAPSQTGSVATATTAPSLLGVAGVTLPVTTVRWIALIGFLLLALTTELARRLKSSQPFEETARIQAKYGHLIVPIVATAEALSWAPYEVTDIKALVQLAESGQRLILHHRDQAGDTYLVNDESSVYRYRVKDNRVRWDEWTAPPDEVAAIGSQLASAAGDHPATGQTLADPDRSEKPEPGGQAHGIGDPGQVGTA